MTSEEFVMWLMGFLEAARTGDLPWEDKEKILEKITLVRKNIVPG